MRPLHHVLRMRAHAAENRNIGYARSFSAKLSRPGLDKEELHPAPQPSRTEVTLCGWMGWVESRSRAITFPCVTGARQTGTRASNKEIDTTKCLHSYCRADHLVKPKARKKSARADTSPNQEVRPADQDEMAFRLRAKVPDSWVWVLLVEGGAANLAEPLGYWATGLLDR
jgi:hypothetical protein